MEYVIAGLLVTVAIGHVLMADRADSEGAWDFTSPLVLGTLLVGIRTVPSFLLMALGPTEALDPILLVHPATRSWLPESALLVGIGHALGLVAFRLGVDWSRRHRQVIVVPVGGHGVLERNAGASGVLFLVAGLGLLILYLVRVGGIAVILNLLGSRSVLSAGRGYLTTAYSVCLILASAMTVLWYAKAPSGWRRVGLVSVVAIAVVGMNATGGRSDTILLALCVLLVWHFRVQRVRLKSRWSVALGLAGALYVAVVPMLREGSRGNAASPVRSFSEVAAASLGTIARGNDYVGSQMLVVGHFRGVRDLWLGRSWLDVLTAPIPRSLFPKKPPVDDGVYLFSIARGIRVEPPMPYSKLTLSAWPLQTFGAAYANFHLPGVLVAFFLLGALLGAVHGGVRAAGANPLGIVLYGVFVWRLQFSNLGLVTSMTFFLLIAILGAASVGLLAWVERRREDAAASPGRRVRYLTTTESLRG